MFDPTVHDPTHRSLGRKFTIAICSCAGTALISLMWIVLRTPPHPYYGVLLITCAASVIIGVGIILGGLIARAEERVNSLHQSLAILSRRHKRLSKQQQRNHAAIENVNAQIDDLRLVFIEEGTPSEACQHRAA